MNRMMGCLKTRLRVLLWVVGVVPVSAVGVFLCWSLGNRLQKQALVHLGATADITASVVEAWAAGAGGDSASAARSSQVMSVLTAWQKAVDRGRTREISDDVRTEARCWLLTSTEAVALVPAEAGQVAASSNRANEKTLRAAIGQALSPASIGRGTVFTYRSLDGRQIMASTRTLPGLGWTVVAEIDRSRVLEAVHRFYWTVLGIGAVVVALVLGVGLWISNRIADPIVRLTRAIHQWAAGDLRASIPVEGHGEIQALAEGLHSMVEAVTRIVIRSGATADQIATVRTEILSSCEQQACSARDQSSAVSETTSAAAELSKNSEQIGENIKTISQMAGHVLAGMEKIKHATDQTSQILTSLNEKSKQIGAITELIDDVADQTNLLAVNASIEAARAGEQGRGFTVVADQIGKLADSTAKSTKGITSLVEVIRHEMSNAIIAMEQSLSGVEEEIQLAKESAAKSKEIAMSANQQISGSRQIAEAMASIDQTMKQIASGAQRSADAACQLTALADELKASMARFKVTEHV